MSFISKFAKKPGKEKQLMPIVQILLLSIVYSMQLMRYFQFFKWIKKLLYAPKKQMSKL